MFTTLSRLNIAYTTRADIYPDVADNIIKVDVVYPDIPGSSPGAIDAEVECTPIFHCHCVFLCFIFRILQNSANFGLAVCVICVFFISHLSDEWQDFNYKATRGQLQS